jgi:hypothetical protein
MRADAYMTKTRYAREMMTEGVMVNTAPTMRLNPVCIIVGKDPSACLNVLKLARIIGGNGGSAGSGGYSAATEPGDGW